MGDIVANVEERIQPFVGHLAGWLGLSGSPGNGAIDTKQQPGTGTGGATTGRRGPGTPTAVRSGAGIGGGGGGIGAGFKAAVLQSPVTRFGQQLRQGHHKSEPCLASQTIQNDTKHTGK